MNRSDEPLFDPRLADWLEDDPHAAPDGALEVVLAAFPSIKQRRAMRVPWRYPDVSTPYKLAFAAAAIVVAVVGSAYLLGRPPAEPGVGGSPTPSPSPSASTDSLDVSTWTAFTSSRYGFSAKYPATFEAVPSTTFWRMPNTPGNMFDGFRDDGAVKWLNGISMLLPEGATQDDWYDEYRRDLVEDEEPWEPVACFTPREDWEPTTVDGVAAELRVGCDGLEAYVFVAGRVYVFGAYGYDGVNPPTVEPGVSKELRDLFELWLTTITLDPTSAVEPTSMPTPSST
jgi:hypothetical protein